MSNAITQTHRSLIFLTFIIAIQIIHPALAITQSTSTHVQTTNSFYDDQRIQISNFKRNTVLLVLEKLSITPSYSLCLQLGMWKCQNKCCQLKRPQSYHTKSRSHQWGSHQQEQGEQAQQQDKFSNYRMFNETQLCGMTNRTICGAQCCISGSCDELRTNQTQNLTQQDLKCKIPNPSNEELCRGSGLLWCDGSCCGFNSGTHKCFKKNHYGIPYIRCPIEAQPVVVNKNSQAKNNE